MSLDSGRTDDGEVLNSYRLMVRGRALDVLATNLAKQGSLVVYPSSAGQEACQVGAASQLEPDDWLLPTYRDSVALMSRGVPPEEVLTLFKGTWHNGYDCAAWRSTPHSTPLATHLAHAVGLGMASQLQGKDSVAVAMCGDGATSEGDFHEAINLAGVFQAPVIFFVQNNGYAISVPYGRQTAAKKLSDKGAGYGVSAVTVDGNDVQEVSAVMKVALERARAGGGPTLIEAVTFRVGPHTNSDDPDRYRDPSEAERWSEHDPVARERKRLIDSGVLTDAIEAALHAEVEAVVETARRRLLEAPDVADPATIFRFVFSTPTGHLIEQHDYLRREIAGEF